VTCSADVPCDPTNPAGPAGAPLTQPAPPREGPAVALRTTPTPRQIQVLAFLAEGLTVEQAARRIGISERAASDRVELLYRRIRACSAAHAVAIGFRAGWLTRAPLTLAAATADDLRETAYEWADDTLRAAHTAYAHYQDRTPPVIAGEREYQRRKKAAMRARKVA
jgi:DNA-binding CsgD family transcriptional regulator